MKNLQLNKIFDIVDAFFQEPKPNFIPNKTKIPLAIPAYGSSEVKEAIDSLMTQWVTMGSKVKLFEEKFAKYVGVKHAIMVNSGSSANLLALAILKNPLTSKHLNDGDEIITPALTWSTTVFPMIYNGLKPVFVDVEPTSFNIDPKKIESAITKNTKAIMLVHLLGNPANLDEITKIAKKYNLLLIEDSCEAHGATWKNKKVGSFGDLSTFSFFVSHHITTMEGGMILTNNDELFEIGKSLRTFGWIRDNKNKKQIEQSYPQIDSRFLFYNMGFNLRPTELQGGFGIHQIKKLEKFIKIRRINAKYWNKLFSKYSKYIQIYDDSKFGKHVYFGYPILIKNNSLFTCKEMMNFLESKKIEVRPIMAGNMAEQPSAKLYDYRQGDDLPNSHYIMYNAFFMGNHHGICKPEREYMAKCVIDFIESYLN